MQPEEGPLLSKGRGEVLPSGVCLQTGEGRGQGGVLPSEVCPERVKGGHFKQDAAG